jgi:hypothetical protein
MGSSPILSKIVTTILDPTVKLLFAVAFLYFFWGVFQMVKGADTEDDIKTGKRHLFYSIIGLMIMFGANALIGLIKNTFQI